MRGVYIGSDRPKQSEMETLLRPHVGLGVVLTGGPAQVQGASFQHRGPVKTGGGAGRGCGVPEHPGGRGGHGQLAAAQASTQVL